MSVLVKGMQIPKNCASCPLYVFGLRTGCVIQDFQTFNMGNPHRPSTCPLVEVKTPHGRLIDADKIVYKDLNNCGLIGVTWCDIGREPTVIEAEE